jgi:hypothetical protein
MSLSWEETAEKLTRQAVQAAEEGRWGTVHRCYQGRAELFRVHDRLRMAMMTVQHLLSEVTMKRRLFERFDTKSESDISPDSSRRVSRHV